MAACESNTTSSHRQSGVRIAVVQGAAPDDWRRIHERINTSSKQTLMLSLAATAAGCTFAGMFGVALGIALAIIHVMPEISPYYLAAAVMLPSLLCGAAAGQAGGNLFLRFRFRLDDATRRGFATRLSLGRCPPDWPIALKRWLFTGDWLGSPAYDLRLPYARIYIAGDAPASCRDEDALWREIHGEISGDSLWEAGTNIREISYPSVLPAWSRLIEKGDGFADLQKRIGPEEASAWVLHLWRRACRQWPVLGDGDFPATARRECFEMHFLSLSGGRDALVVVLRPTAFVSEAGAAGSEESIAA
ncbi:MAG: hypothetical protein LUC93_13075 [Planctomycetaceae bacterium]|nr:hypothetical protein [Planctomycetaceae bacterium]